MGEKHGVIKVQSIAANAGANGAGAGNVQLAIQPGMTWAFLAKRNCGKSVLCKYVLKKMLEAEVVDVVYLFSTTEHLSHSFDCVPPGFTVRTFDAAFIEKVIAAQSKRILGCGQLGVKDAKVARILFIFDDIAGSIKPGSNEQMLLNRLFATSRHIAISICLISQNTRGLTSPLILNNLDVVFMRKLNDLQLKSLYDAVYYPGSVKDFTRFVHASLANTDYEFLCFDNRGSGEWSKVLATPSDFAIKMVMERGKETARFSRAPKNARAL